MATTSADPLGLNIGAPPSVASSSGSTRDLTSASRSAGDAPIGIPLTSHYHPSTGQTVYTTSYIPPVWIAGQGPAPRQGDRPFDSSGTGSGSDLPNKQPDGTSDWYRNSDTYAPASQAPAQVQAIQEQLVQAGLLDPSAVHWGLWGATDQAAYATVLGQSNVYGVSADTMLSYMAAHPNTPTVKLDSPVTIESVADSVLPQILGRNPTPGELAKLEQAWGKVEQSTAQQIPNGPAASQEQAPSLTDFVQQWAKEEAPGDYQHHNQTRVLGWLAGTLGPTTSVQR